MLGIGAGAELGYRPQKRGSLVDGLGHWPEGLTVAPLFPAE